MRKWEVHPYSLFHTAVSTVRVMSPAGKSGVLLGFKISRDLPDPPKDHLQLTLLLLQGSLAGILNPKWSVRSSSSPSPQRHL